MAEVIKGMQLKVGDTFVQNPVDMPMRILEVVSIGSTTKGQLGGTIVNVFEPKTGEYYPVIRRSNGEVVRISSITDLGEIEYK
jgi:hypothetical protein